MCRVGFFGRKVDMAVGVKFVGHWFVVAERRQC